MPQLRPSSSTFPSRPIGLLAPLPPSLLHLQPRTHPPCTNEQLSCTWERALTRALSSLARSHHPHHRRPAPSRHSARRGRHCPCARGRARRGPRAHQDDEVPALDRAGRRRRGDGARTRRQQVRREGLAQQGRRRAGCVDVRARLLCSFIGFRGPFERYCLSLAVLLHAESSRRALSLSLSFWHSPSCIDSWTSERSLAYTRGARSVGSSERGERGAARRGPCAERGQLVCGSFFAPSQSLPFRILSLSLAEAHRVR